MSNERTPDVDTPQQATGTAARALALRQSCSAVTTSYPHACSFDATDPKKESLWLRCQLESGVPAPERNGWRARVVDWWYGVRQGADDKTGEVYDYAALVLVADKGEMCVLAGDGHAHPALRSFLRYLDLYGPERAVEEGIPVRVSRVTTARGYSCWNVLPD